MSNEAAISLATGLGNTERVTVTLLVAVGAAESGHPTLMFFTEEAVRSALAATAVDTVCEGCRPLPTSWADTRRQAEAATTFGYRTPTRPSGTARTSTR